MVRSMSTGYFQNTKFCSRLGKIAFSGNLHIFKYEFMLFGEVWRLVIGRLIPAKLPV
jgi:hypothetical protein